MHDGLYKFQRQLVNFDLVFFVLAECLDLRLCEVDCVQHLEDDMGLASVRELGIVDLCSVEGGARRNIEPSTHGVILDLQHARARGSILVQKLLHQEEHSTLISRLQMHLQHGKPFDKCVDQLSGELLFRYENDLKAFQERDEVLEFDPWVSGLLKHSLQNCVQRGCEVLLVHVENSASTHFEDLERTQEASQNI